MVPLLVPLILFSGYIIPFAQLPLYFRPLYDVSFFQHALAILDANQFQVTAPILLDVMCSESLVAEEKG